MASKQSEKLRCRGAKCTALHPRASDLYNLIFRSEMGSFLG